MAVLVFGHKNPDTDSIAAAIALADLMNKRGMECTPVAQGAVTPESDYVLNKFGVKAPAIVESVAGKKVFLVDFSDYAQAPADMKDAEIVGVADHHKLGDITTSSPLLMWVWPVGCSCTVIKNMYDFYGVEIPKNIAGIMLCAILSDTVIFKSPTTTDDDKKAVQDLANIAGVSDFQALGMEMFKVKSAVDGVPARELLFRDYKDFDMNGTKVGIGQLEVIDLGMLDAIKADLLKEVQAAKTDGRDAVFLLLTDIMKEGSEMLIATDDGVVVEKAFGTKGSDSVWLPGVMSRKKDVVPKFEAYFKG